MPVATETAPYTKRVDKLRKLMRAQELPALLVQKDVHVHYLTGFTGEDSLLLVTPTRTILLTDFRFTTQLADECPGLELHVRRSGKAKETMDQSIAIVADKLKLGTIAIESDVMTIGFLQKVQEQAKHTMFIMSSGLIDQLRVIKDRTEIAEIRTAIHIAEQAWLDTVSCLNPELTEIQVAHILEDNIRKHGGSGFSFDPIIAAGPRSALPHGRASQTKIGSSNWLLFDWGAKYGRRISDLTRTIHTGKISAKLERIYQVVYKAQTKAIASIRPGVTCGKVDLAARGTIEKAGFGEYFGHGLGHGIGLEVHEQPRFSAGAETILEPGMIVTVEPGIYLPGVGGVRLEDNILVTKTGHEVLSSLPKTWEEARFEWCRTA